MVTAPRPDPNRPFQPDTTTWVMAGDVMKELMSRGRPPAYDERAVSSQKGSADGKYGLRDLVRLAIDHGGLGSYTHVRYETLRHALGVKTDLVAKDGGPRASKMTTNQVFETERHRVKAGAPRMAAAAVAQARAIERRGLTSPFAGFLEAPPDLHALYLEFDDDIKAAVGAAKQADRLVVDRLIRLAMAAVLSAEPEVEGRTARDSELRAARWPDPPPPASAPRED